MFLHIWHSSFISLSFILLSSGIGPFIRYCSGLLISIPVFVIMETWFIKGFSRLFDFYERLYGITVLFLVFRCVCVLRFCADRLSVLYCCTLCSVCVLYSCGAMFINVCENGDNKKE